MSNTTHNLMIDELDKDRLRLKLYHVNAEARVRAMQSPSYEGAGVVLDIWVGIERAKNGNHYTVEIPRELLNSLDNTNLKNHLATNPDVVSALTLLGLVDTKSLLKFDSMVTNAEIYVNVAISGFINQATNI